jgi:hypothetical protein
MIRPNEMWCSWEDGAGLVLDLLCRTAERTDLFAPLGVNPDLRHLDPARCTAYVLEGTRVRHPRVTTRVIPREAGAYPGIEGRPLTRFRLPDGSAVVCQSHVHAVHLTDDPRHLDAVDDLFARLDECVAA